MIPKCPYIPNSEKCEGWHQGVKDAKKMVVALLEHSADNRGKT